MNVGMSTAAQPAVILREFGREENEVVEYEGIRITPVGSKLTEAHASIFHHIYTYNEINMQHPKASFFLLTVRLPFLIREL